MIKCIVHLTPKNGQNILFLFNYISDFMMELVLFEWSCIELHCSTLTISPECFPTFQSHRFEVVKLEILKKWKWTVMYGTGRTIKTGSFYIQIDGLDAWNPIWPVQKLVMKLWPVSFSIEKNALINVCIWFGPTMNRITNDSIVEHTN